MSPIPKPPKALNPVQKAIAALIEETQRKGSAVIDGVVVHPNDLPALQALLNDDRATHSAVRSSLFGVSVLTTPPISDQASGGPLTKAWREQVERMRNTPPTLIASQPAPVFMGRQVSGMSWDEQHTMERSELQQQLEDSLWARATMHTPAFTQEMLYAHVGPGHMTDDWYVKRVYPSEVHLLCKCEMILVLSRCMYTGHTGQCENLAYPKEATLRRDTRCGQHHGQ